MKRLNKILALVLAMTMMFGVVSICASAANTTDAGYKVRFVDNDGNAITSVSAGQTVNVIVSIKTDGYSPIFAFLAFYDYKTLTHIRQNGTEVQNITANNCRELYGRFKNTGTYTEDAELLEHENNEVGNGYVNDWGFTGNITVTPHKDLMWDGIGFTDAQKAKYKGINFGYLVPVTDSNSTVNTKGEWYDMVRFRFLASADIATLGEDTFFLLDNDTKTYITIDPDDEPLRCLQASAPIKASNLTVEYVGGSTPTPPPATTISVENLATQVQWQDKDAGLMRVAFRGNIKDYDATTDLVSGSTTELNKLTEIGVVFSKTDSTPTLEEVVYDTDGKVASTSPCTPVPAYTIYDFTSGGYFYRAVVGSIDYTSTETLYANAYIVYDGTTYTATNAVISTTGAQAYANGVANNMPAK